MAWKMGCWRHRFVGSTSFFQRVHSTWHNRIWQRRFTDSFDTFCWYWHLGNSAQCVKTRHYQEHNKVAWTWVLRWFFVSFFKTFLQDFMKIAFEKSKTHGAEARKFVVIFDMDNFSMKQYAYRPAAELVINTFQIYANNYPEILKYCYIINGKLSVHP